MKPKLEISPKFTLEDIRKVRDYDYEMTKNMTSNEMIDYYNKEGEKAFKRMAELKKKQNVSDTHIRKPNRYKDYDYSKSGGYFITICSKDKQHIFSKITTQPVAPISDWQKQTPHTRFKSQSEIGDMITRVNDRLVYPNLELTEIGKIVEDTIIEISNYRESVNISSYVIMPNHIHLIILMYDMFKIEDSPTNKSEISSIVRFLKSNVTKKCGAVIWQKRFYDHILRDENDFYNHSIYIQNNPISWIQDEYYS